MHLQALGGDQKFFSDLSAFFRLLSESLLIFTLLNGKKQ